MHYFILAAAVLYLPLMARCPLLGVLWIVRAPHDAAVVVVVVIVVALTLVRLPLHLQSSAGALRAVVRRLSTRDTHRQS